MAIFHGNSIPAGAAGGSFEDGYSLRFNSADTPHLEQANFQPTSPYTVSFWVKRGKLGANQFIYRINSADTLYFDSNDQIFLERRPGGVLTTRKFRDTSSWYHIVVKSTPSDATLYVNGVQEATFSSTADPFSPGVFLLGRHSSGLYFDGYLAEFHWIDGQSLGPESFGESGTYGEWKPIEYTGGHGTNGFYLPFSNPNNAHDITANGNAQHSTLYSKIGASSILFDGATQLQITGSSDFVVSNTDTATIEFWFKLTETTGQYTFIGGDQWTGSERSWMCDAGSNYIRWTNHSNVVSASWTADTDWHHYAVTFDSGTQKVYLDGTQIVTGNVTSQWGSAAGSTMLIGNSGVSAGGYSQAMHGYIDELRWSNVVRYTSNFTPSTTAFTEDVNTKLLIHSDTTNGSTVFEDSSGVLGGLGHDASANSNNFTLNNIAVSDQVLDNPENNYPVMNYLNNQPFATTFAEGNLQITTGGSGEEPSNMATMGMSSGKWYFEVYQKGNGSINSGLIGIRSSQPGTTVGPPSAKDSVGRSADGYAFYGFSTAQNIVNNGVEVTYGSIVSYTDGDLISVAVDLDNNKCYWAKNGTWINSANPSSGSNGLSITAAASTSTGEYFPCIGDYDLNSYVFVTNFGQDGTFAGNVSAGGNADSNGYGNFKYAVPSGFNALCTANLPEPAVKPAEHFNTVLYTGTGSSQTITTGFDTDLVWIKNRGRASEHVLVDTLRGDGKVLHSHSNSSEVTPTGAPSLISTGFTVSSNDDWYNRSSDTYVSWNWKAGTTTSGTTTGSGTGKSYSASYNTDAGFSIINYVGNGTAGHTIPHHLGATPDLIIIKGREGTDAWYVYGSMMGNTKGLQLSNTGAANTTSEYWNNTSPTSSVWTVSFNTGNNTNDASHIAYCFRSIEGYSKVGSYEGNGSSDGTFVYCGFKPAFLLIKNIDVSGWNWRIMDSERSNDNVVDEFLEPNETRVETTDGTGNVDFLSNGFKFRVTSAGSNGSNSYLYMAFAEQPFKYTNAR